MSNQSVVFICSPYAGDVDANVRRAKEYGRFAIAEQSVPIIPHLMYPQILRDGDPKERQLGIDLGLTLLERCDELWVFGDFISSGMRVEIDKAKELGIPLRSFASDIMNKD